MNWGWNRILRAGKNFGPILRGMWTKVLKIFGQYRVLSSVLAQLSMSCITQKIFAIVLKLSKNQTNVKVFLSPIVLGVTTLNVLWQIVSTIY